MPNKRINSLPLRILASYKAKTAKILCLFIFLVYSVPFCLGLIVYLLQNQGSFWENLPIQLGDDEHMEWRNELRFLARNEEWIAKNWGMWNELILKLDWILKILLQNFVFLPFGKDWGQLFWLGIEGLNHVARIGMNCKF